MLKYHYIPLEGATMVERKHPREIAPPMMTSIENMILSRSDNTLTLRPDFEVSTEKCASGTYAFGNGTHAYDDYLNSVTGLYGSDNLIFFNSFFPLDASVDKTLGTYTGVEHSTVISRPIDSGTTTAAVTSGSNLVTTSDTDINMNQKAYRGACIVFDDDTTTGRFWPIRKVIDKQTIALEDVADFTNAATEFTIYQSHGAELQDQKFHVEQFLSNTIYGCPSNSSNLPSNKVIGPWAASITETENDDAYELTEAGIPIGYPNASGSGMRLEPFARKGLAVGSNIAVSSFPEYSDEDTGFGYFYSYSPQGGVTTWAGLDIVSSLPADTEIGTNAKENTLNWIVYDTDNSVFWSVVELYDIVATQYDIYLVKITDPASGVPTVTFHKTDLLDITDGRYTIQNLLYNPTDNLLWIWYKEGSDWLTDITNVTKVELVTYTTSTSAMPGGIEVYGAEYSPTLGDVLVTGVESGTATGHAYRWNGAAWSTLTNPAGTPAYYGCGIYDNGADWVFGIAGGDKFYAWGKNDGTTIVEVDVEFNASVQFGAYRAVTSCAYFSAESTYDTNMFISGHRAVALMEVDPDTCTISWNEFVDISGIAYIHKVFASQKAGQYNRYYIASGTRDLTDDSYDIVILRQDEEEIITWVSGYLTPISDLYRARAYGVLNGYVVLFGLREYDTEADTWTYTPRRIRWTAPATVNDFTEIGSGTADVKGSSEFLDARSVNGRIVTFESSQIGVLIPRGIVDDPWDYDIIHEGIRILSNPVVVNDMIYFIGSDGLLWMTNGSSVTEAGSSFDITKYDDFREDKPVWLVFSSELNSLLVFYAGQSSPYYVTSISLANGGVSKIRLFESSDSDSEDPKSIVTIENAESESVYVSRNPLSTDTDDIPLSELQTGSPVTGIDEVTDGESDYWYGRFDTGYMFASAEGEKVNIKHVIVHTYTDGETEASNPLVSVEVKSLEDESWYGGGDKNLEDGVVVEASTTATLRKTSGSGSNEPRAAFSSKLGTADGASQTYRIPWPASNVRMYTETGGTYTAMTQTTVDPPASEGEYYIDGTHTIKAKGANDHSVYCFCENYPPVIMEADDYVETDYDVFRVESITDYDTITLDHAAPSSETGYGTHKKTAQMENGDGQIKLGIDKSVDGVLVRITVLPKNSASDQPTVAKITGISFGYAPAGTRTLEATGS